MLPLSLPPYVYDTRASWVDLPPGCADALAEAPALEQEPLTFEAHGLKQALAALLLVGQIIQFTFSRIDLGQQIGQRLL